VLCAKAALRLLDQHCSDEEETAPSTRVAAFFKGLFMARAAGLVFRTYGGIYAYAMNFAAQDLANKPPVGPTLPEPEIFYPEPEPGIYLKLTRYKRADFGPDALKGPVMLANGFGVKASAFAVPTTKHNLVEMLVNEGYDVWLFDYRGSGDAAGSTSQFTIDDVAQADWPAAISMVLDRTGAEDVQIVAHCVGALSLFMAVLAGETRIRSIIASQVGAHGIVNWFKNAQFDLDMGSAVANGLPEAAWPILDFMNLEEEIADLAKTGLPVVDVRSGHGTYSPTMEAAFDALLWSVPHFADVPCKNPTCHRINFVYGPTYRHENLNQATHAYISEMFGAVSTTPFLHLALMFDAGRLMSAQIMPDGTVAPDGVTDYYAGHANFSMPVHFISGARNAEILPEATLRTRHWLQQVNEQPDLYTRHVYPDYGHMDCFVGRDAWQDIFPDLIARLDTTARPNGPDGSEI
jgi:pimeloyl-ACP methyl ester carboxylesterase